MLKHGLVIEECVKGKNRKGRPPLEYIQRIVKGHEKKGIISEEWENRCKPMFGLNTKAKEKSRKHRHRLYGHLEFAE